MLCGVACSPNDHCNGDPLIGTFGAQFADLMRQVRHKELTQTDGLSCLYPPYVCVVGLICLLCQKEGAEMRIKMLEEEVGRCRGQVNTLNNQLQQVGM